MAKSSFRLEHDVEKRSSGAARIRGKYPDRVPVIVEKADRSDIPNIDKKKLSSCSVHYLSCNFSHQVMVLFAYQDK